VHVPGAFEIPSTVQHVIKHTRCDAVITLGAVIRGETPHFDYICSECTRGLGEISIANDIPVIFGVLTVDNTEQAMDRAGDEESNKGAEAAQAAIEMINVFRAIS
jgi:6,7-dimethyl-8-ribityllumazine synthase